MSTNADLVRRYFEACNDADGRFTRPPTQGGA